MVAMLGDRARVWDDRPNQLLPGGRMGQVLERLSRVPWRGSGLPVYSETEFVTSHREKVDKLGDRLATLGDGEVLRHLLQDPIPLLGPLVVTHGDPGNGNYLETTTTEVLIDWENAHVGPCGLDLVRAMFMALLVAARSEVSADRSRARAVMAGYLGASDWHPTTTELRWWLGVAGVQFTYNRWEREGEPRVLPWRNALAVLANALDDDAWLIG